MNIILPVKLTMVESAESLSQVARDLKAPEQSVADLLTLGNPGEPEETPVAIERANPKLLR